MDAVVPAPVTLETVVDHVARFEPCALSRWGDGEWGAILGHATRTCDGQRLVAPLCDALRNVLRRRPSYWIGMQALARRRYGAAIDAWLQQEHLTALTWCDAGVFHTASIRDTLGPLIEALRLRHVVLVGPPHLATLSLFQIAEHIEVPPSNAFSALDATSEKITHALAVQTAPVIAVSAGPAGKLLVDQFAARATILDFGSLWEPYVGVANRTYHAKTIERLRRGAR